MKRILSIILTVALCLSICSFPALADYSPAENFALALNMTDKDTYVPGKTITRAGFAEIIARMCNLMDANKNFKLWQEYVYGADNNDTVITDWGGDAFMDVDPSLPQYDAIMKVYKYGYMNGMTETHFGPNYDITMAQVVKVMVSMLGYDPMAEVKGGYPNGYIQAASTIKLTSGMSFAGDDYATYEQVAQIIYNALDIPVYEIGAIGEDYVDYVKSENTFLTERLGLERAEGILTDNGITSLYGVSKAGKDAIVVGDTTILVEDCLYARDYIGKQVEAYYMPTSGKNHLVYACVSEDDESITIDARDFSGYQNGRFTYFNENGKLESESLTKAKLIYNGAALGTWSTAILSGIMFGDITIVSTSGDRNYDLIIANDYMVGKVTKKDAATGKVYAEPFYTGMESIRTIDLSEASGAVSTIYDSNGNIVDFEDIMAGDVVSVLKSDSKSAGKALKVIVSANKIASFTLTDYEISDKLTIKNADEAYEIEYNKKLNKPDTLVIGDSFAVYFDFMGNAVWYEKVSAGTATKKAILLDSANDPNGLDSVSYIRLYTDAGKVITPQLAERVWVNGKKYDADEVKALVGPSISEPVLYELNAEETELKAIITPLAYGEADTDNRGWYAVTPKIELMADKITATDWATHISENGYVYSASNGYLFSGKFGHSTSKTVTFSIPNDAAKFDDEKMFSVNSTGFMVDERYIVNGYSNDRLSLVPEVLVTASNSKAGARDVKDYTAFLVSKVYSTLDADGEEVTALKGIYFDYIARTSKEMTFTMSEETVFIGPKVNGTVLNLDSLPDDGSQPIYKTKQPYTFNASGPAEIEAGDIIRFATTSDGVISSIRLCYDKSTGNTFSSGSRNKYAGGPEVSQNETVVATPAILKGSTLKFAINGTDPALFDDKDAGFDETKFRVMTIGTGWIYIVEESAKGLIVKKGTLDDIITYEVSGEANSNVILLSQYGNLNYGTVIYR